MLLRGCWRDGGGGQLGTAQTLGLVTVLLCFGIVIADDPSGAVVPCPGRPHCVSLVVDGTIASVPPIFRKAMTNTSVNEIVLAGPRYVLRPTSWTVFTQQQPYRLQRNLTIRGNPDLWSVMDFSLIEKKVLIASGVTVTFKSLVLFNIRKLGGFGLDFFMGETDSRIILDDVARVKPACQLPADVLRSAQSFQRVSAKYPPNDVRMLPHYCITAALTGPEPQQHCFQDVLQFDHFSLLAFYNDPDKGSQFPGYILYQENTTRLCQATITQQCLDQTNGDEELCMAMLVASAGASSAPGRPWDSRNSGQHLSPGAAAGVAVAGAIVLLMLMLLCILRRRLLRALRGRKQLRSKGQDPDDVEQGLGSPLGNSSHPNGLLIGNASYTGCNRAISQQVTLATLLGTGSFGRVYKGRWHSSDVAIKIITVRSREELPRVLREAEVMMQLDHPNIVRAFHASVWNPAEQAQALKEKAAREKRNSSSSSNARAYQTDGLHDAAPAGSMTHEPSLHGTRNAPRRNSSNLHWPMANTGPAGSPAAAAAPPPEAPAATIMASGQQLVTPSTSSEPLVIHTQLHTSSTCVNSSSGNLALKSGQLAKPGAAARATGVHSPSEVGAAASGPCGAVTGWLPLGLQHSRSQQQLYRLSSTSADCSSTMVADVHGRTQARVPAELMHRNGGAAVRAQEPYLRSASDSVLDTTGHQALLQVKAPAPQQLVQQVSCDTASTQQQQQQQQQEGGLRRYVLQGWRHRPRRESGGANGSSDMGTASSATTVVAVVPASSRSASSSHEAPNSGASTAVHVSSGGAVAIMEADEARLSVHGSSRRSGAAHTSWGGSGSCSSRHAGVEAAEDEEEEEEEQRSGHADVQVWIILELCTGGTLLDAALGGRFRPVEEADGSIRRMEMAKLLSRLLETASGMAYLHSKGVMHGDLKAGNILLQSSIHGSYGQIAKISDFGLSAVLLNGSTHRSTASLGTITHMAPELLRNGHMSPSADVYSFGILMWEVFCAQQAWHGLHYGVVVERVVVQRERPPIPPDMFEQYRLLMERCWDMDPGRRPSFEQIVTCLELMLDGLDTSEGGSDEAAPLGSDYAAASADSPGAGWQAGQAHRPPLPMVQQQPQQQWNRLSAPPVPPAAAAPAAVNGAALSCPAAVGASQDPGAGCSSAHVSPPTPTHGGQGQKPLAVLDSGLTTSGGLLGQAEAVTSSQVHSSTSAHRHNSQGGPSGGTGTGTGRRLPSVLDDNAFLQDL